jgi:hypothetical protein
MERSRFPPVLLIADTASDVDQVTHILGKYHISNEVESRKTAESAIQWVRSLQAVDKELRFSMLLFSSSLDTQVAIRKAAELRQEPSLKESPLVFLADSREAEEEFRASKPDNAFCVIKPLGFFKLLEALQKLGVYWIVYPRKPEG